MAGENDEDTGASEVVVATSEDLSKAFDTDIANTVHVARSAVVAAHSSWLIRRMAWLTKEKKILEEYARLLESMREAPNVERFARLETQARHMQGELAELRGEHVPRCKEPA